MMGRFLRDCKDLELLEMKMTSSLWKYIKRALEEQELSIFVWVQFQACWVWGAGGTSRQKCPIDSWKIKLGLKKEFRISNRQPFALREHDEIRCVRLGRRSSKEENWKMLAFYSWAVNKVEEAPAKRRITQYPRTMDFSLCVFYDSCHFPPHRMEYLQGWSL